MLPINELRRNDLFEGLNSEDLDKKEKYVHFRPVENQEKKDKIAMGKAVFDFEFLEFRTDEILKLISTRKNTKMRIVKSFRPDEHIDIYSFAKAFTTFISFNGKNGSGEICGGNLCLMQCLMGTPYCPDYENKILFFEETEGSAHGIHRILWQFKLAGILDKLSGVVIGTFSKSNQEAMLEACFDVLKEYDFPILYNVHAGHIENPLTIPIGARATIQKDKLIIDQPFIK